VLVSASPPVAACERGRERLNASTVTVEAADAMVAMRRMPPESFDLVFLDPPFGLDLFQRALEAAAPLVVPDGFIYLEADRLLDDEAPAALGLRLHRHARAGAVHAHLFQRPPAAG
jgi:16S rRNA G966 N2-methylase RsmD